MSAYDEFHLDRIGRWSEPEEFVVEADRTIAYAKATNDPLAPHLDGTLAPPVFAVVPAMQVMADVTMQAVPDRLMMRILHGEHEFRFRRPLEPGETVSVRAKVIGIEGKSSGVVVTTLLETTSVTRGDLVNEQYFVGFFRGGQFDGTTGRSAPSHAFDATLRARQPDAVLTRRFDEDQTFRYSEPAGDPMPIHLDEDFAKEMGLPGIIIHGLCTIAFISHALIGEFADGDPTSLRRLAVRLSKPGRPGETLTTSAWRTDIDGDVAAVAFETAGNETPGKQLVVDGLAEFTKEKTA